MIRFSRVEAPEIVGIIKRRRDELKNSSSLTDTSEVLVKRADMTRLLANEYDDLLKKIENAKEPPPSLSAKR